MKLKNKGRVYPPPSSSSSGEDHLSILKLLPAAILALASVLSLEDRQVLAYLISRSLKTSTTTTTTTKKRSSKKPPTDVAELTEIGVSSSHKPPVFDCDCFDCYTSYWFRWDCSPNRELIHQVIEAFEDHLANGEVRKPPKKNVRPKIRDGNSKTAATIPYIQGVDHPGQPVNEVPVLKSSTDEAPVFADDVTSKERDIEKMVAEVAEVTKEFPVTEDAHQEEETTAAVTTSNHKGLARKVLPDVLGFFNSRLWDLWNPNM